MFTFGVSNFRQMKKNKKYLKILINIDFLFPNDFIIYFIFSTPYQDMVFVKIVCVIIFFIKIALKITVFALIYFNNIVVQ